MNAWYSLWGAAPPRPLAGPPPPPECNALAISALGLDSFDPCKTRSGSEEMLVSQKGGCAPPVLWTGPPPPPECTR